MTISEIVPEVAETVAVANQSRTWDEMPAAGPRLVDASKPKKKQSRGTRSAVAADESQVVPAAAMTTAHANELDHRRIPVALIEVSKTNPRKHFDEAKLAELADSIVRYGVLQPILVRPLHTVRIHQNEVSARWYAEILNRAGKWNPQGSGHGTEEDAEAEAVQLRNRFELVAGERRFRATRRAGFEDIPAVVRELTDKEALEVQVIENLQRADLAPLEEAEGYATLIRQYDYDADTLAEKIGKSRSYVYARLKLIELCDSAKKELDEGAISHSIALLIARIPDQKLQQRATDEIVGRGDRRGYEPMSFRQARSHLEEHYMLRLQDAAFKKNDATLVPEAGPCTTCPFRTGNGKDLFGDIKNSDVCTKPPCFEAKEEAHWVRLSAEAVDRGLRVLPPSEVERVFGRYGHGVDYSAPYVELDKPISYESKKTYRTALGDKAPQITVARNPRDGKIYELVPRKAAEEVLRAAGLLRKASASNDRYEAQQRAEAERRKLERAIEAAVIAEVRPKLPTLQLSTALLRIFTKGLAIGNSYHMEDVFKRRGLKWPGWNEKHKAIVKFVDGLSDGEMILLAAELQLTFTNNEQRGVEERRLVRELAAIVGVDASAIDKRMRADAIAKKKTKAAKAKTAATTKAKPKAMKGRTATPAAVAKGKKKG